MRRCFLCFFFFFSFNLCYRRNFVVVVQRYETNSLGCAPHNTKRINTYTDYNPGLVDDHQVVVISDTLDSDQLACFLGYVDGFYTLTATVCHSIFFYIYALTIATFRNYQYGRLQTIYRYHANNFMAVTGKAYSADACYCSSHLPDR